MRKNTKYRGYIQSLKWKEVKYQKYKNTKNWCLFCRSKENLQIHHVLYRPNLYNVQQKDLVIACKSCHFRIHTLLDTKKLIYTSSSPFRRIKQTQQLLRSYYSTNRPNNKTHNSSKPKHVLRKSPQNSYLKKSRDLFGDFYMPETVE